MCLQKAAPLVTECRILPTPLVFEEPFPPVGSRLFSLLKVIVLVIVLGLDNPLVIKYELKCFKSNKSNFSNQS